MGKISVVISVVEAEKQTLLRAVASVSNWADEIVIVDMTTSGVEAKGARVYKHKFMPWVEPVRNFGIAKAKGDWILILDPDEEVPSALARKLQKLVRENKYQYFRLPRKNLVFGQRLKYSRWWPDYNIRFFKKGTVSWSEVIHTVPETVGEGTDLPARDKFAIIHHHYNSIEEYLEKLNRYTTQQANFRVAEGYEFAWQDLLGKPLNEFLSRYFAGRGFKDGLHGLALALLQATSELIVYLKIWQKGGFKPEKLKARRVVGKMRQLDKDVFYWRADALGGPINLIKRKFKLR